MLVMMDDVVMMMIKTELRAIAKGDPIKKIATVAVSW